MHHATIYSRVHNAPYNLTCIKIYIHKNIYTKLLSSISILWRAMGCFRTTFRSLKIRYSGSSVTPLSYLSGSRATDSLFRLRTPFGPCLSAQASIFTPCTRQTLGRFLSYSSSCTRSIYNIFKNLFV